MNRYAIKRTNGNKVAGILNYDETTRTYTIDIPDGVFSILKRFRPYKKGGLPFGSPRRVYILCREYQITCDIL